MNHDELQRLRDRLIQASQQHPRSRLQQILDRLLGRVDGMMKRQKAENPPAPAPRKDGKAA